MVPTIMDAPAPIAAPFFAAAGTRLRLAFSQRRENWSLFYSMSWGRWSKPKRRQRYNGRSLPTAAKRALIISLSSHNSLH